MKENRAWNPCRYLTNAAHGKLFLKSPGVEKISLQLLDMQTKAILSSIDIFVLI